MPPVRTCILSALLLHADRGESQQAMEVMAFALRYQTSLADNIYTALCAHAYPHTFHLYTWSCCAHRSVSEYLHDIIKRLESCTMEMSTRLFPALYKAIVGHACFYTAVM